MNSVGPHSSMACVVTVKACQRLALVFALVAASAAGCNDRVVGTVEPFAVGDKNELLFLEKSPLQERTDEVNPTWGDPIRRNSDVVTMQVESTFIQDLPFRLTGSKDVIIFANVWENAAAGYENSESLTSIIYIGKNQKVPGKCNFFDALSYGPTKFKGHPLRVRFTVMVLQKRRSEQQGQVVDVISAFATAAAPQYAGIFSPVAKSIQAVLRAQPDIICFDFEGTWMSDQPEGLLEPIRPPGAVGESFGPPAQPVPVYWLRYGRFVLLETESYDFSRTVSHQGVTLENGRLIKDGAPLQTNYMVVRFTPGQQPESNEVLARAAQANEQILDSLRRSDEDIAEAFEELKEAADGVRNEVLRVKAEQLARSLARKHKDDAAGFVTGFDREWAAITGGLTDAEDKEQAKKIGEAVRDRFKAMIEENKAATKTIEDPGVRETFRTEFPTGENANVKVGDVPFTIAGVEFDPDASPFGNIKVTLAGPSTAPAAKVKVADVQKAVVAQANKVLVNQGVTGDPIKTAEIENAGDLANAIEP